MNRTYKNIVIVRVTTKILPCVITSYLLLYWASTDLRLVSYVNEALLKLTLSMNWSSKS